MKNISQWFVLAIIAVFIGMRLTVYGDLRLSVANRDTQSYFDSSKVNLFSWEAFTGYRPYTTNFIYKIFTPPDGYRLRAFSDGANTVYRKVDRGLQDIAVLQVVLSIMGWPLLAWVFSSRLKNGVARVGSAFIIMLFGFTPQMADWDSVLGAESLSISLFVIAYAILIWLAFAYHGDPTDKPGYIAALVVLFALLFFWAFTRDINANLLIFPSLFILGLYILPRFRRTKLPILAGLVMLSIFILGFVSTRQRLPWVNELIHVWESDIVGSEGNMQYFTDRGMPEYETPEFYAWFEKHAPITYMKFLVDHPVYTARKFLKDQYAAFSDNMQPYFKVNEWEYRPLLTLIGNYLHPKSGSIFLVDLILLLMLWNQFLFQKNRAALPWIWLMTWTFLIAASSMFFNIFGDSWALVRHTLSSTTTYRLLMWMLLLILVDFSVQREKTGEAA
ncbi:MAG: hypothetical protein HY865_19240 [Chloroflexi bacterium]|nr:hypothetical protein [Chloroflexota bacterium]